MELIPGFETETNGSIAEPTKWNNNLNKVKTLLDTVTAYVESFIADMSGDYQAVISGGNITDATGLTVTVDETVVWLSSGRTTCAAATVTLAPSVANYIYANYLGEFEISTTLDSYTNKVVIGKVTTSSNDVLTIEAFDNKIFTINEMLANRIQPLGITAFPYNGQTFLSFSYVDPEVSNVDFFQIQVSTNNGQTWTTISNVYV